MAVKIYFINLISCLNRILRMTNNQLVRGSHLPRPPYSVVRVLCSAMYSNRTLCRHYLFSFSLTTNICIHFALIIVFYVLLTTGNFSAPAEFYVFVGVMAFLYCIAALVLYIGFDDKYRKFDNVPIIVSHPVRDENNRILILLPLL